jgi:ABC-type nickel/cobalt efflux system permease component RcnA
MTTTTMAVAGVAAVALVAVTIGALASAVRRVTTPTRLALWMFAIALIPLVGAWVWFAVGRRAELRAQIEDPASGPALR